MNNKELIRAAKIGNVKLIEAILNNKTKISNVFERWAPENDCSVLDIIFKRKDKNML